jgi:hypothetical protein
MSAPPLLLLFSRISRVTVKWSIVARLLRNRSMQSVYPATRAAWGMMTRAGFNDVFWHDDSQIRVGASGSATRTMAAPGVGITVAPLTNAQIQAEIEEVVLDVGDPVSPSAAADENRWSVMLGEFAHFDQRVDILEASARSPGRPGKRHADHAAQDGARGIGPPADDLADSKRGARGGDGHERPPIVCPGMSKRYRNPRRVHSN